MPFTTVVVLVCPCSCVQICEESAYNDGCAGQACKKRQDSYLFYHHDADTDFTVQLQGHERSISAYARMGLS